ncbi:hypothetical protein NDU88_004560 [Pleurodeles waltl]|uniref:Uncharacterized protein n=1 Tax=Pleurodeles waltl TaxID=8319 RepID=A0AAV7TS84_PLEWA|nr:hypothetical protein NDU88_004560 [Pleurodeles waltl]
MLSYTLRGTRAQVSRGFRYLCCFKMGKRKAVDAPTPLSGTKKLKKRSSNPATSVTYKGTNPLDDIDTLFEEVEAILKSKFHPLPMSINDTSGKGKIPEIFKKKKSQLTNFSADSVLNVESQASMENPLTPPTAASCSALGAALCVSGAPL